MAIHRFHALYQRFTSLEELPDHRSDIEREASPLQVFDHNNPDISLAERRAKEVMDLMGAWVKVYIKIQDQGPPGLTNDIWKEDSTPLFSNAILLKATYRPDAQHIELNRFGIDGPLKIPLTFLRADLLHHESIGDRLILPGDQIEIPYNDVNEKQFPMRLEVVDAVNDGSFHYRWLYWKVIAQVARNDEMQVVKHD